MFIGSIDKDSLLVCERILQSVKETVSDIYVGCSGNFRFDRLAASKGFRTHSNDVSLYSRLIAAIVQKETFPVTCTNGDLLEVFDKWDDTLYTSLVKVMFAMDIGKFAAKKNAFQRMMYDNYRSKGREFFDNTLKYFCNKQPFDFQIADFCYGDCKKHIESAPQNAAVFMYAPTYKGGYEKMFKFVEDSFDYQRAEYDLFDPAKAGIYYKELLETRQCCLYSDTVFLEIQQFIVSSINKGAGKRSVYMYSNLQADKMFIQPAVKVLERVPECLPQDAEITDDTVLQVASIPVNVVNHYKHLYMSTKVNYSEGGDFALGFFADKKLFGFAVFTKGLSTTWDVIFLHSDFVVPSKVDRLSKLLLYLLRSDTVRKLVQRRYLYAYAGMVTSVFTDKPVSMKYRGIWKKDDSKKRNGVLTYTAEFTGYSIEECYRRWKMRKPL